MFKYGFDLLAIKIKLNNLKITNYSAFISNQCSCENQYLYSIQNLKPEVLKTNTGLNGLQINEATNELKFVITAKFVPNEYRNLINNENISLYLNKLKNLNYADFDIEEAQKKGIVNKLHSTMDIKLEMNPNIYLESLEYCIRKTDLNKVNLIKQINNQNLIFQNNSFRLTAYNKGAELKRRNKFSTEFYNKLSKNDKSYFETVIRFEEEINGKNKIQRKFNLRNSSLTEILNSDIKPVKLSTNNLLEKIGINYE